MKLLFVGDPHATVSSLEEMQRLIDLVQETAIQFDVNGVCFLGDQYDSHSVVHLPVMAFWDRAFRQLKVHVPVFALVGNHDKTGVKGDTSNSMMLHKEVTLFDTPKLWYNILFVPYIHDPAEFVQICRQHPEAGTLVCHQTFTGSLYENGWVAPDGVEPNLVPQKQVISGHVHTPQVLGKVHYPGAPRWRTVSDANTERAIWVVEFDSFGTIIERTYVPTDDACTPIYALNDTPTNPAKIPSGRCKVVVDVYGPSERVNLRKRELEELGVRVRLFPDADKAVKVRESDGIHVAFRKFFGDYKAKNNTSPDTLWDMAQARISWLNAKSV